VPPIPAALTAADKMRIDVTVKLVSVNPDGASLSSTLRVVGARILGG
jgi:hypothetical protein